MEHPITPTLELIRQWIENNKSWNELLTTAARWGADQELEACCKWIDTPIGFEDCRPGDESKQLRATRRPKLLSLKQRALTQLQGMEQAGALDCNIDAIRQALESIPDLQD